MAAFLGSMGTDWLLKRAFKFMLKRNLGCLLRNEVDLDMLNVSLGTGTLEVRSALLNTDYLDAQLGSPYWEIAAGYVGALKAEIPFTNLYSQAVSLTLDEALLTIRPRCKGCPPPRPAAATDEASGSPGAQPGVDDTFGDGGPVGWDDYGFGQATVADGVNLIAGGIENVLQRFRLQARNITLRIELPPLDGEGGPASLVVVRLDDLTYAGEATPELTAPMPAAMRLQKLVTFAGLTVELFEDVQEAPAAEEPDVSAFSQMLTPSAAAQHDGTSAPEPGAVPKEGDGLVGGSGHERGSEPARHTSTADVLDYRERLMGSWMDVGSEEPSTPLGQQQGSEAFTSPTPSSQTLSPQLFLPSPFAHQAHGSFAADDDADSDGSAEEATDGTGDSSHVIICSAAGVGCSGRLRLLLTWRAQSQLHPDIDADLTLDPLQVQLHPHHLPLLLHLSSCLGDAAAASAAAAARDAPAAAAEAAEPAPAARSIIEGMLLPDTTAFATEFISQSWGYGRASLHADRSQELHESAAQDEFFDALASIRSSVSSFVTTTAASLRASDTGESNLFSSARSGVTEVPHTSARSGSVASAASVPHPGSSQAPEPKRGARKNEESAIFESLGWQLRVMASDISLVLWYPDDAPGCNVVVDTLSGAACDYRARFSMECCDLDLTLAAGPVGALEGTLRMWRLEAVEHIPAAPGFAAASVSALEEVIRVPEVLPPAAGGARPVPSFAGVSVLPLKRSLYSSTLSQLSALSASFGPISAAQPQVQIWPVVAVAGGHASDGGTPSLSLALSSPSGPGTESESADVSVALRAVSMWLSLPFLQRLEAFLSLLSLHQQQLATAAAAAAADARSVGAGLPVRNTGDSKYHAETALDAILDDLQEFQAGGDGHARSGGRGTGVRVSCTVPRMCAVVLLPPLPNNPNAPVCHGYGYLVVEVFSVPSVEGKAQVPMIELRNSGDMAWEAEARIGRAKAYLVGSPYATDFGFSNVLQGPLQANCVVDIVAPQQQQEGVAVMVEVRWSGGVPCPPHLIDSTWARVRAHADEAGDSKGAGLETVHFQEAAIASSPLRVRLHAPEVLADIARADLAALWQLADAVLRWRAAAAALATATAGEAAPVLAAQTAILVEAGVKCNLQHVTQGLEVDMARRSAAAFLVDVEELRAFAVTGLGGSVDASAAALTAAGVTLTGGAAHDCLLHVPSAAAAGRGRSAPCLEIVHVQRAATADREHIFGTIPAKSGDASQQPHPMLAAPTEACASVAARGATFSAVAGDLTLPWLGQLGDFFSVGCAGEPSEDPPPPPLDLDVHLKDCALRYEPAEASGEEAVPGIAAALLVGGLHTHINPADPALTVEVASSSLFCADTRERGREWAPGAAADVPGAHLLRAGYHLIAAEPLLRLALRPPTSEDGTFEMEITNERLHSTLTASAFRLVGALGAQVAASFADAAADAPAAGTAAARRPGGPRGGGSSGGAPSGSGGSVPAGSGAAPVRVMEGVKEDAYRLQRERAQANAASVFLEGGWLNPELGDVFGHGADLAITFPEAQLGPSQGGPTRGEGRGRELGRGGVTLARFSGEAPPLYDDHFDRPRGSSSERGSADTEEMGHWFKDGPDGAAMGPPEILPDHVPVPPQGPPGGFSGVGGFGRGAIGPLPPHYPAPATRLILRDLRLLLQLCCSPGDNDGDPMQPSARLRVELEVEGLCVQAEAFPPGGSHVRRSALSVRHAELRDCAPRPEGGSAWRRILAYHATSHVPRDAQACLFQVELEAVRPGGDSGGEELRLGAAVLPLRLRVDQAVVEFLQVFFAPPNPDEGDGELINWADEEDSDGFGDDGGLADSEEADSGEEVFFQRAELWGFSVMVDYWPRRMDLAALKAGNLAEVLNLAPWGNVLLQLPPLRLSGAHGWAALGTALGDHWLKDITTNQAHKFLTGYAPIRSLVRVGTAAGALLAIPAEQLQRRDSSSGGSAPRPHAATPLSRKLQRSLTGLVRAILAEMLGLSASALGSVQVALSGASDAGTDQPAGVHEGLKVAAERLQRGFSGAAAALKAPLHRSDSISAAARRALRAAPQALVAPLSGGAAAARAALLGARNALDPERYEERRLSR
ncbi:probable autophagy-related protein 2 at C-terminar half [Coccomyxa sp. Obi]|nr:probable autophagy-related protein 2 at C-terminar half [Coccomyxa sp. Obi]